MRSLRPAVQGFLNATATGILVFLLWDILSHASAPVEQALAGLRQGNALAFWGLAAVFGGGLCAGLGSLVVFNARVFGRVRGSSPASPRTLSLMIASGLGLHNLSEGLAIGQSAASGAVAFASVLVIGFALHNMTEGFGFAAPLALDATVPSWGFLLGAGLIGGAPTFIGATAGYVFSSQHVYVLFLALAAGALLSVIGEMFHVGRRLNSPGAMAAGLLLGFLLGYGTDLFLTLQSG